MKLRQLEYFNALCTLKTYSKVASKFNVSQPTVSYAIKSLEESLKVSLITRDQSHSEISLTAEGEIFRNYSENAIQQLDMGKAALKSLKSKRIKFGISANLSRFYALTDHLTNIENILRNEVSLIEDGSKEITSKISSNELDIALFASSKELYSDHLDLMKLTSLPFKLAVSKKHEFSNSSTISLISCSNEDFVIFNERFVHNEVFWKYVNGSKFVPNILAEVSDIGSFKTLIERKNSIGILVDLGNFKDINLVKLNNSFQLNFNLYLGKQKESKINSSSFQKIGQYFVEESNKISKIVK
ncbi:LysR family transcriptional regulator [Streptococcus ratti]|uniref:Malolactic fermentation system transcription activator n=1 Tax=Streptococcus ratti FA-1 = DSM 20564 TaxID=699248 RepID=A0ABP2R0M6_STRRT|nr:LysR family transcriptional regulator [Streptococcus ratti]EJN94707.1 malolactic fermentation system transcription activator [Streptococcus ratti FA-1 = DSM 20564]EMP69910.1 Malolactic regulator [Streptococcus ratti FA-1 = DSM 20564]QEY06626.1 LysR family transcriptional regulator [Streptococcus ratti]VEI60974.1 LysR family transcriptional regulator [Streptococcus mutans]